MLNILILLLVIAEVEQNWSGVSQYMSRQQELAKIYIATSRRDEQM